MYQLYAADKTEPALTSEYIDELVKLAIGQPFNSIIRRYTMLCCLITPEGVTYTDEYKAWYVEQQKELERVSG